MLENDPAVRGPAEAYLPAWQGIFLDAAKRQDAIEGRVF
jgi:hypothetical protein